jgi:hypothetical protein
MPHLYLSSEATPLGKRQEREVSKNLLKPRRLTGPMPVTTADQPLLARPPRHADPREPPRQSPVRSGPRAPRPTHAAVETRSRRATSTSAAGVAPWSVTLVRHPASAHDLVMRGGRRRCRRDAGEQVDAADEVADTGSDAPDRQEEAGCADAEVTFVACGFLALVHALADGWIIYQNDYGLAEERVTIACGARPLNGVLARPASGKLPHGLVVFVHGDGPPTPPTTPSAGRPRPCAPWSRCPPPCLRP